jgi:L-serine deaminase
MRVSGNGNKRRKNVSFSAKKTVKTCRKNVYKIAGLVYSSEGTVRSTQFPENILAINKALQTIE